MKCSLNSRFSRLFALNILKSKICFLKQEPVMNEFLKSLTEFVSPVVRQLAGEGSIPSQMLRFALSVIAIFSLPTVFSMVVFPNELRLPAIVVFMVAAAFIVWLGMLALRQNYKLMVEVFDDADLLSRTAQADVAIRGAISDDKRTGQDGKVSWIYTGIRANEAVTIQVRKANRISQPYPVTLKPEEMSVQVVLPLKTSDEIPVEPEKTSSFPRAGGAETPGASAVRQPLQQPEPVRQAPPVSATASDNLDNLLNQLMGLVANSTRVSTLEMRRALCVAIKAGNVNYEGEIPKTFSERLVQDLSGRQKFRSLIALCNTIQPDYEGNDARQLDELKQRLQEKLEQQ
jgi:hypothetical protein